MILTYYHRPLQCHSHRGNNHRDYCQVPSSSAMTKYKNTLEVALNKLSHDNISTYCKPDISVILYCEPGSPPCRYCVPRKVSITWFCATWTFDKNWEHLLFLTHLVFCYFSLIYIPWEQIFIPYLRFVGGDLWIVYWDLYQYHYPICCSVGVHHTRIASQSFACT